MPEAWLSAQWGIPKAHLVRWRKENAAPEDTAPGDDGQPRYSVAAQKKAAAHFACPVPWLETPAEPETPAEATPEPATTRYAVSRLVVNPRLVLFREKNAAGEFVGPDLRLQVRESKKFTPGMDLTGRVRLKEGHTDYYDLTSAQPRTRGRW